MRHRVETPDAPVNPYGPIAHDEAAEWMLSQNPVIDPHPGDTIHVLHLIYESLTNQIVNVPPSALIRYRDALEWVKHQNKPENYYVKTVVERVEKAGRYDRDPRPISVVHMGENDIMTRGARRRWIGWGRG